MNVLHRPTISGLASGARAVASSRRPSGDLLRIVGLWAAWLVIICAFQIVVQARLAPEMHGTSPSGATYDGRDPVLTWTAGESGSSVTACQQAPSAYRPRLSDPAMNQHVVYDSEYYISIAAYGYDDPKVVAYTNLGYGGPGQIASGVPVCDPALQNWTSLDYAFMPGYPYAMRPIMAIESVLPFTNNLSENGRATLAGIIVSALGGLLAMLALARMMAYLERRRQLTSPVKAGAPKTRVGTALWYGAGLAGGLVVGYIGGIVTNHPEGFIVGLLVGWLAVDLLIAFLDGGRKAAEGEAGDESAHSRWGGAAGLRAALYLLVFPTGFYLAQVYTEGLFIGLCFMACALAVEKKLVWAAVFAVFASVTRQAGFFLFLPIGWAAIQIVLEVRLGSVRTAVLAVELGLLVGWIALEIGGLVNGVLLIPGPLLIVLVVISVWALDRYYRARPTTADSRPDDWRKLAKDAAIGLVAAAAPLITFVVWRYSSLGQKWIAVENDYFGRKFDLGAAEQTWVSVWNSLATGVDKTGNIYYSYFTGHQGLPLSSASNVYIALDLFAMAIAFAACVWLFRRMPGVALFGLAVVILSAGSSAASPQGMIRYVIAVPAIFLMLASIGRNRLFDRSWVLGSTLVMGMLVTLYTLNFWVS